MSALKLEYRRGNLWLPRLGLWLDPREPQNGEDIVFVSHAHSDHIAPHREVVLSGPTALLMKDRLPGARQELVLPFGKEQPLNTRGIPYTLTLLPAGHILGSAMAWIRAAGETLLYTGDFKLRPGLSAETCEPREADYLVMETTFGRPGYHFPPTADVLKGIVRFCREALEEEKTPVLFGYSLGKSQEILCALGDAGLPLVLHGAVHRLTKIYQQFGKCFPPYEPYQAGNARGKVLLCPPGLTNSAMLRNLGPTRTAVLTGWAVDQNCRYRYQCDAAFPLSDHADFPDLIALVERVRPKQAFTLHGFAADFAQTLRDRGIAARALSEQEQFTLGLMCSPPAEVGRTSGKRQHSMPNVLGNSVPPEPVRAAGENSSGMGQSDSDSPDHFGAFAATCAAVAGDSRKLEKIRVLSEYLLYTSPHSLPCVVTWFSGRPFASSQNRPLQLGWAVLRDALCQASGIEPADLHLVYLKHSDFGETAFEILHDRQEGSGMKLTEVNRLFEDLYTARGPLGKIPLLAKALRQCTAIEAKFLVKIITGDLRIGLKEGLLEEAIGRAYGKSPDEIRRANLLLGDIGQVAALAHVDKLSEAVLQPFRPIKLMLASPESTARAAWRRMQDQGADAQKSAAFNLTSEAHAVWTEDKYDGIRCQLHKSGSRVEFFSRDLKEITRTFPDLAEAVRGVPGDFVVDGEIIAMRGEEVLPFAELQRRLGRREDDLFMRDEVPVRYVAFDLLWDSGVSLLNETLRSRRSRLENLTEKETALTVARVVQARSPEDIDEAFAAARARGNEGLMIKDPESVYSPGRRGLAWLKLKKALATLDCVVVGAEYGHGKRSKVLSDYTFAVRDEASGDFKVIGKAYTGLTDAEIQELTSHFLQTALRQRGRYFEVKPDTVLEIAFDRLQPSSRHPSGLAMRFPRIVRIRTDKPVNETDTLSTARRIAAGKA